MDNGKADIIAGIRELKAKAAAQLTGNEYYMIVQQLDSLASSVELSEDAARSVFALISARLAAGAPAVSAGGPEIPPSPDTPAQPDAPSGPDVPVAPDSPAQPVYTPGPEIPSPPPSPPEPQAPPEVRGASAPAAASQEPIQIIAPAANSFGMPQATSGVRYAEAAVPSQLAAAATPEAARGLASAIMAARALVEERLSGNSYYAAANLLGQLQILPPVDGGGEAVRPEGFEGALALLRREAAHLTGIAHDEAARVIAALDNVLMPAPRPVAAKPAEAPQVEARQPDAPAPEAAPEPEPEPRTRFDDLADAAWQRVLQNSAADAKPGASLNGGAPAPEMASQPVRPAPAAAAQTEMMAQDIGEAFNDGGSESRSSEPCYLHEFEPSAAQPGASGHQEPAVEVAADAPAETQREAAVSAEAATLIALAESGAGTPLAIEAAAFATALETAATRVQAVPAGEPIVSEVAAAEPAGAEAASVSAIEAPTEAAPAAAEAPAARPEPPAAAQHSPAKPAKRGFFGRIFGGSGAENRQ